MLVPVEHGIALSSVNCPQQHHISVVLERADKMEFNEKLQELRKQKELTQEELAAALFVSRTAISKWESGRGYPNIDSLKSIARFFGVTVDELLSGEELLNVAQADTERKQTHIQDLVFGLLDCSMVMCFFLPLFGQKMGGTIHAVSLLSLTEAVSYLKFAYCAVVTGMIASGIAMLALQNCRQAFWAKQKHRISLALHGVATVLFIASLQPYAATFSFIFLTIKMLLLIKWR